MPTWWTVASRVKKEGEKLDMNRRHARTMAKRRENAIDSGDVMERQAEGLGPTCVGEGMKRKGGNEEQRDKQGLVI